MYNTNRLCGYDLCFMRRLKKKKSAFLNGDDMWDRIKRIKKSRAWKVASLPNGEKKKPIILSSSSDRLISNNIFFGRFFLSSFHDYYLFYLLSLLFFFRPQSFVLCGLFDHPRKDTTRPGHNTLHTRHADPNDKRAEDWKNWDDPRRRRMRGRNGIHTTQ